MTTTEATPPGMTTMVAQPHQCLLATDSSTDSVNTWTVLSSNIACSLRFKYLAYSCYRFSDNNRHHGDYMCCRTTGCLFVLILSIKGCGKLSDSRSAKFCISSYFRFKCYETIHQEKKFSQKTCLTKNTLIILCWKMKTWKVELCADNCEWYIVCSTTTFYISDPNCS